MQLWMWMWVLIVIGGVAILAGVGWSLHRFAIRLEDAGYLYYRKQSPTGGGGSVFGEVDKLVRPSIQHTINISDTQIEQDEIDGD